MGHKIRKIKLALSYRIGYTIEYIRKAVITMKINTKEITIVGWEALVYVGKKVLVIAIIALAAVGAWELNDLIHERDEALRKVAEYDLGFDACQVAGEHLMDIKVMLDPELKTNGPSL